MRQRTQTTAVLPPAVPFPVIVAIIGPAECAKAIDAVAAEQELHGRIAVVSHVRPSVAFPDAATWNECYQARMYELALRRIDMADEVIVVGDAIHGQIAYAQSLHKPVRRRAVAVI
jgi:hypothetical protein